VFLPAPLRIFVRVSRPTAIALVCLVAVTAACGSGGPKASTQVREATLLGCSQRAKLPEQAPEGRAFRGALEVKLTLPDDALIWRRTLDNVWADLAMDELHVWVSAPTSRLVLGIDPHRRTEVKRLRLPFHPVALATGGGRLWAVAQPAELKTARVLRVDADTGELSGRAAIGSEPVGVAYGAGAVWVADAEYALYRVDPDTLAVRRLRLPDRATALAVAGDTVWVATEDGTLVAIDGATDRIGRRIHTGLACEAVALAASGHVLWVTENLLDAVVPIDTATGKAGRPVQVGDQPVAAVLVGDDLWVASAWHAVTRVDVERRRARARYRVGFIPAAVVGDEAGVWVVDLVLNQLTELPLLR
jgi:hypothetical protein